jgi:hypothetical protein
MKLCAEEGGSLIENSKTGKVRSRQLYELMREQSIVGGAYQNATMIRSSSALNE